MDVPYSIDQLLSYAVDKNASDLHVTVSSPPVYRINGQLIKHESTIIQSDQVQSMARHLLDDKWELFQELKEYDFSYEVEGIARFRVNTFYQRGNISISARVIPEKVPTIEQLQLPSSLYSLVEKPQGLILVTGPTGSGKSTTLAAMIHHINEQFSKHIITLEDPIEYLHTNNKSIIQQREVGLDTKSFANGLRASLRQDPDVILVGEMRDLETISTAITAAETGHLVLATLHTNSAAQTINRIIDVFPPHQQGQIRIQLASVLSSIISQRLFIRADGRGRTVATEILMGHPSIANLIRNEKVDQINNILQTSKSLGMHTLAMSIKELIQKNMISEATAAPYITRVGE